MKIVHTGGNQILKNGNHRGEACKSHKKEEESSPNSTKLHMHEDLRQSKENKGRSGIRLHTETEAGRENNESRNNRHKGIQSTNLHTFTNQGIVIRHIGAENLHCRNPK